MLCSLGISASLHGEGLMSVSTEYRKPHSEQSSHKKQARARMREIHSSKRIKVSLMTDFFHQ